MMGIELLTILMFGSLIVLLVLGLPVAFACGAVGIIFTAVVQSPAAVTMAATRTFGLMTNYLLAAIPLFIFMACILEQSGIIKRLYETVYQWMGGVKGGVASATIAACGILAAMTGVIGAVVVTMGIIALPEMLRRNYDKRLSCGAIVAGGTLGILIPPSVLLIIYGLVDQSSIGKLYAGCILPGFMLAGLFIAYITIRTTITPSMGPPVPSEEREPWPVRLKMMGAMVGPAVIIFLVLGTIIIGVASPTEAAGLGAVGAMILTGLQGHLKVQGIFNAAEQTLKASAMVLWTMFGANIFVSLYVMSGGGTFVSNLLLETGLGSYGVIGVMLGILVLLGMFIDWTGIIMLTVPIFGPIVRELGFDPIWFGVLFAVTLQTSFLTPPFGYALFYLKGVAPANVKTTDIWWGAMPFIFLQILGVSLLFIFPQIATFLPDRFF
jgi:tripartite ATP-independent transporter DctM subunit